MERAVCDLCGAVFDGIGADYALTIHRSLNHPVTPSRLAASVPMVPWDFTETAKTFLKCNKIDPEN